MLPMVLLTAVLTTVSIDGHEDASGRSQSAKKDRRQTAVQTKQAQSREIRRTTPVVKKEQPSARATVVAAPLPVPPRAARPACDRGEKPRAE